MKIFKFVIVIAVFLYLPLTAQDFLKVKFEIKPLGREVNSEHNDYAPFLINDLFFFTSDREGDSFGKSDVYYIKPLINNDINKVINAGKTINTDNYEGALSFAGDGKTVVFAAKGREDNLGKEDIFIAEMINGEIQNIKSLGKNVNTKFWDSQPSISYDGNTIYFTSNRNDGFGGEDIWVTHKNPDGLWSKAENLGKMINTEGNERSPLISQDNASLYFASDGLKGYGKKDIFQSRLTDGKWSEPVNLGQGINSQNDDYFFFVSGGSDKFYFCSDRSGGKGKLDIYEGYPNVFTKSTFKISISIVDSISKNPINGVIEIKDRESGKQVLRIDASANQKEYVVELQPGQSYTIIAAGEGFSQKIIDLKENADKEAVKYEIPFYKFVKPAVEKYFTLKISLLDSLSGMPLDGSVNIFDMQSKERISINTNSSDSVYTRKLSAGRSYKIEGYTQRFNMIKFADLTNTAEDTERRIVLLYKADLIKEFNFSEYEAPFFVTGYYRLNILKNLDSLFVLLKSSLKDVTYVEKFTKGSQRHNTYKKFAKEVEIIVNTVNTYVTSELFPHFDNYIAPDEILEITVIGYVDPRPFKGKFLETTNPVFEDYAGNKYRVPEGDALDNFKLSGLRAWHTGLYLNDLFYNSYSKENNKFGNFKRDGKLRFRYVAGFIQTAKSTLETQRQIRIIFSRFKKQTN